MTLRVETITPDQQDDLIAALRPYEHELQPEWIEPPGYFERKLAFWKFIGFEPVFIVTELTL